MCLICVAYVMHVCKHIVKGSDSDLLISAYGKTPSDAKNAKGCTSKSEYDRIQVSPKTMPREPSRGRQRSKSTHFMNIRDAVCSSYPSTAEYHLNFAMRG